MKPELHSQAPDARRSSQDCLGRASGYKDKLLWSGLPGLLRGTFLGWDHSYLLRLFSGFALPPSLAGPCGHPSIPPRFHLSLPLLLLSHLPSTDTRLLLGT